jgi:beta propeller domain-containing protein
MKRRDAGLLAGCCLITMSGCTGTAVRPPATAGFAGPAGSVRLLSFHGCGDALAALRTAAEARVGPYGLAGGQTPADGGTAAQGGAVAEPMPAAAGAAGGASAAGEAWGASAAGAAGASGPGPAGPGASPGPAFSGTNDYEAGVDEPDLVKTDGHRIVTVANGVLRVIDAASRTVTGRLDLAAAGGGDTYGPVNLLLSGDHALLLTGGAPFAGGGTFSNGEPVSGAGAGDSGGSSSASGAAPSAGLMPQPAQGARLLLVDLAGQPRVLSSYSIEGSLVDARQAGPTARVVIRSQPRLPFPAAPAGATTAQRVKANRSVIASAGIDAWLPHFAVSGGGAVSTGRVPCAAVSRPSAYSGANLVTVLTFDLAAGALGSGDGVTVIADGDTVYGTGSSLYVASDQRWESGLDAAGAGTATVPRPKTEIYRFDTSQPGPPTFAGGGSVPGCLLNQYAMSEWQGYLRVATTTGTSWAVADGKPPGASASSSAVYVLTARGPVMRTVGEVAGLGAGERIYAVRFTGPAGYVATFRQTDPLYALDLSDPAHPRVRGALALTGYSAYLYPVSSARLIGIGQQADAMGRVGGTQVSLFGVSALAAPARLAGFALSGAVSGAEFDPHAFLYWPRSHLAVVPIEVPGTVPAASPGAGETTQTVTGPRLGALVLRVGDAGITKAGFLRQPAPRSGVYPEESASAAIERSLVIGQSLWTISQAGAMAYDLGSLRQLGWVPFTHRGVAPGR